MGMKKMIQKNTGYRNQETDTHRIAQPWDCFPGRTMRPPAMAQLCSNTAPSPSPRDFASSVACGMDAKIPVGRDWPIGIRAFASSRAARRPSSRLRVFVSSCLTRQAFTLVELLVVISIIALLLGLLLPAVLWAQKDAYITATEADLHALSLGLDQYHADFNMYPNSSMVDGATGAYGGAIPQGAGYEVMAEALLGFLPGNLDGYPPSGQTGYTFSPSPLTPLSQTQGFTMAPYKKVYGPYISVTAADIFMVAGTSATYPSQYYFTDAFGQSATTNGALLPILYFSANTNPAGTTASGATKPTIFGNYYTNSLGSASLPGIFNVGDDNNPPGPSGVPSPGPGVPPTPGFLNLIGDPQQDNTVDSGATIMGSNGYLLVSAGSDGQYFTADDIVYGQ